MSARPRHLPQRRRREAAGAAACWSTRLRTSGYQRFLHHRRLADAIHLSSWTGREVALDFDDDEYLAQLNARIRDEGKFTERA